METDLKEFPCVKVLYTTECNNIYKYKLRKKLNKNCNTVAISIQQLMSITTEEAWNKMMQEISAFDRVLLVDDMKIHNVELLPYKEFYLKAYYYKLKEQNANSYVLCIGSDKCPA